VAQAEHKESALTGRRWWLAGSWYLVLILASVYVLLIAFRAPEISTGIEASTEYLRLVATEPRELRWDVGDFYLDACIQQGGPVEHMKLDELAGIQVGVGVAATIIKQEGSQEVHIELVSPAASSVTAAGICSARSNVFLADSTRQQPLYGSRVNLSYTYSLGGGAHEIAPARVFPLRGIVTLGQDPDGGAEELLLSGKLSLHSSQQESGAAFFLLDSRPSYIPVVLSLSRGDVILPPAMLGGSPAEARGYIRVTATEPLQVGYYVHSKNVTVQRAGNATLHVTSSIWDRLRNEPQLSGGLAVLFALFKLPKIVEAISAAWPVAKRHDAKGSKS
jgi:hypothetical protein